MAVLSVNEMPRNGTWKFGEAPELKRRFLVTVDDASRTTPAEIASRVGIDLGSQHPDWNVKCTTVSVNEGFEDDPDQIEFVAEYGFPENGLEATNPLLRNSVWKFETMGQAVPAFRYLSGSTWLPLTNSAYDYFEGVTSDEAMTRVTIQSNLRSFPAALATAATNRINSDYYLFGPRHTWKCQGITGELKKEIVINDVVSYWQVTSVLMYRASGWDLQLPDMGYNYLDSGQKRRVMTFDFENDEWVPSPVPMGLNGAGAQTFGPPAILTRQIYLEGIFNILFGSPPQ